MKSILITLIACAIVASLSGCSDSSSSDSNHDLSTPQATIEALFETIRTNDTSAFMNIIATRDDFRSYAIESDSLKPVKKRRSQKELDDYVESCMKEHDLNRFRKRFSDISADGTADGIKDWKETVFAKASYERDQSDELLQRYPKTQFTYGEYIGGVNLGALLIKCSRGWVLARPGPYWNMEYKKMYPKSLEKLRR